MKPLYLLIVILLLGSAAMAFDLPKTYLCHHTPTPIAIDGKLDDAAWKAAAWTDPFEDIEGSIKPHPRYLTRAKLLWDDHALYIAAQMEEPNLWATIVKRDSVIFRDNDFEVFIDPDGDNFEYGELEINALNTQWDLFLPKPYKDNGHPNDAWNIEGLRSAVQLNGSLNHPADKDSTWTLEIALPWIGLRDCAHSSKPPHDGDQWRVNFSRVEWTLDTTGGVYQKVKGLPEDNWVWSPQHVVNMHRPETWGIVQFTTSLKEEVKPITDPFAEARVILHAIYYAQTDYFKEQQHYASELTQLKLDPAIVSAMPNRPTITLNPDGFLISLPVTRADGGAFSASIRQDSHFTITKQPTR